MREILFRGKRVDNGEWAQGGTIVQFLDDGERNIYIPKFNEKCETEEDAIGNLLAFTRGTFYKVYDETVSQFTGLVDNAGVKIFEGDVVRAKYPLAGGFISRDFSPFTIKHDAGCLSAYNENENRYFLWELWDIEVIGNVHDNS